MRTPDGNFSHDEDVVFLILAAGLFLLVLSVMFAVYRMTSVALN